MIAPRLRVLLIEDDPGDATLIEEFLAEGSECPFHVEVADRLAVGLKSLARGGIDTVLLDLGLPDSQGLETFRKVQQQAPNVPIVVLSGQQDQLLAEGAVREGALDYLVKGEVCGKDLMRSLHYAVERKGAEEALRQSEQRYKTLLESVTDYIYSVQVEGHTVATTHGAGCTPITGYTPEEFAADSFLWYSMVHEEDRQTVIAQTSKLLSGADVPPLEHRIRHKNGSVRWIRNTTVVRRNDRGQVLSYDGLIVDVTERKRAEEALKNSEERYRLLFERNLAGIFRSTFEGKLLTCNDSFAHILGYPSAAEVQKRQTWEFYFDRAVRDALLVRLQKDGILTNQEVCMRRQDGSIGWVLINVSLVRDGDPVPGIQGTIIDITERKRAVEAHKDAEALYLSLVESIPISMFRKDLEGRFTFANKLFCDSLGKALAEVVGKTDRDFFPPELAEKYRRDDHKVLSSGKPFEDTESYQSPHGERLHVAVMKTPVYDAQKRIIGTQGMFWDVTANKWAQEQKTQLRVARAIQQKLLPTAAPQLANYDFGGASHPAEACSGDYFDYIVMDGAVDVVLGDVSGHGFGPALLAAVTHSCLRTLALSQMDVDIELILSAANRLLLADTDSEHFVTLIFARVNVHANTLIYSNAGHPAGFVLNAAGEVKARLADTGPLLGVFPNGSFPIAPPITLAPGDLVLIVSDGILEAMPDKGSKFGVQRMLEVVRAHQQESAQQIVDALCRATFAHYGKTPQLDDITAVIIKAGAVA